MPVTHGVVVSIWMLTVGLVALSRPASNTGAAALVASSALVTAAILLLDARMSRKAAMVLAVADTQALMRLDSDMG